MARVMKQSGPPEQLLDTMPTAFRPQKPENPIPAMFSATLRGMTSEAMEGSDPQGAPDTAGAPGSNGVLDATGVPGLRDALVVPDGYQVP